MNHNPGPITSSCNKSIEMGQMKAGGAMDQKGEEISQ
jgi:hypothetical protein